MKNKEKFAKEIVEIACSGGVLAMSSGIIRKCVELPCHKCSFNIDGIECDEMRKTWAESEYIEPRYEIDWASVPVDTPVIIKGIKSNRRYFSRMFCQMGEYLYSPIWQNILVSSGNGSGGLL